MNTTTNPDLQALSTEIVSKYDSIAYVPSDYIGRLAFFETFEGRLMEGRIELGTGRAHADLIITFEDGGWANTGSYIYLAD
jgi:hypothetical protein